MERCMKTLGLIGGMSWESSAQYYRLINEEILKPIPEWVLAKARY